MSPRADAKFAGLAQGRRISDFKECLAINPLAGNVSVEHPKANVATKYLAMEDQAPNIHVMRSVWRRIKKGKLRDLEIRDLEPVKDVKGGRGGVTDKSKSITGSPGTTGSR